MSDIENQSEKVAESSSRCYPSIDVPLPWLLDQVREANECADEATEKKMYVTAGTFFGRAEAFQELIDEYNAENPQDAYRQG